MNLKTIKTGLTVYLVGILLSIITVIVGAILLVSFANDASAVQMITLALFIAPLAYSIIEFVGIIIAGCGKETWLTLAAVFLLGVIAISIASVVFTFTSQTVPNYLNSIASIADVFIIIFMVLGYIKVGKEVNKGNKWNYTTLIVAVALSITVAVLYLMPYFNASITTDGLISAIGGLQIAESIMFFIATLMTRNRC